MLLYGLLWLANPEHYSPSAVVEALRSRLFPPLPAPPDPPPSDPARPEPVLPSFPLDEGGGTPEPIVLPPPPWLFDDSTGPETLLDPVVPSPPLAVQPQDEEVDGFEDIRRQTIAALVDKGVLPEPRPARQQLPDRQIQPLFDRLNWNDDVYMVLRKLQQLGPLVALLGIKEVDRFELLTIGTGRTLVNAQEIDSEAGLQSLIVSVLEPMEDPDKCIDQPYVNRDLVITAYPLRFEACIWELKATFVPHPGLMVTESGKKQALDQARQLLGHDHYYCPLRLSRAALSLKGTTKAAKPSKQDLDEATRKAFESLKVFYRGRATFERLGNRSHLSERVWVCHDIHRRELTYVTNPQDPIQTTVTYSNPVPLEQSIRMFGEYRDTFLRIKYRAWVEGLPVLVP